MIARIGCLDTDPGKLEPLDQVLRHLSASAGKIRPLDAVAAHGVADPVLRTIDGGKHSKEGDNSEKCHGQSLSKPGSVISLT